MSKQWSKLVLLGNIIALVYFCTENDIEHYHLRKEGIITRAYIYKIGSSGKGPIPRYRFYIKGVEYKGFTISDTKVKVGDTITIRYLEKDPNVNESETYFK